MYELVTGRRAFQDTPTLQARAGNALLACCCRLACHFRPPVRSSCRLLECCCRLPACANTRPLLPPCTLPPLQIVFLVTQKGFRPSLPADCHPGLAALIRRCWAADPRERPDASGVAQALLEVAAGLRSDQRAGAGAAATG